MIKFAGGLLFSFALMGTAMADAVDKLKQFNQQYKAAECAFYQTVISPEGRIKQEGEGAFAFSRPGKFRWEVKTPFPQLIVSNGKTVSTFDPDLEQVSVRSAEEALANSPSALLFGSKDLSALFELKNATDGASGLQWLEARPKSGDQLFDSIRIGFKGDLPEALEIRDSLGQLTRLTFSQWVLDTKRPEAYYEFVAPEGVDVLQVR